MLLKKVVVKSHNYLPSVDGKVGIESIEDSVFEGESLTVYNTNEGLLIISNTSINEQKQGWTKELAVFNMGEWIYWKMLE